jgi:hypothetical protein
LGGSADLVSELNTKLERMTGRNEQLAIDTKTLRNELHTAKADLTVSLAQVHSLSNIINKQPYKLRVGVETDVGSGGSKQVYLQSGSAAGWNPGDKFHDHHESQRALAPMFPSLSAKQEIRHTYDLR